MALILNIREGQSVVGSDGQGEQIIITLSKVRGTSAELRLIAPQDLKLSRAYVSKDKTCLDRFEK